MLDRFSVDFLIDKNNLTNDPARRHFNNTAFTGYDMDRTMLRIGDMNMMTHGIDNPHIAYKDSLSDQNTDANRYTCAYAEKNGLLAA
jgi:type I restriction enzyme M protein